MLIKSDSQTLRKTGKDFFKNKGFLDKFYKLYSNSAIAKLSQDTLKDKELKNRDTFEYKRMVKSMRKINAIRPDITSLYVFLLEQTAMKNRSMNRDFYKIIEHTSYKTIPDNDRRKVGDRSQIDK